MILMNWIFSFGNFFSSKVIVVNVFKLDFVFVVVMINLGFFFFVVEV